MAPQAAGGRLGRHIHLLAILWLVVSAMHLIEAATLVIVGNTLFGRLVSIQELWPLQNFLRGLLSGLGLWLFLKALAGFAAGWGLFQRESWARVLTLVLGLLELLHIPFGTALGIYTIWVLFPPQAEQEYRQLSRAA